MLRGFYTVASGMRAQQRHQEALANNIANLNTPGYKADQATLRSFPELLIQQMGSKKIPTINGGLNLPTQQTIGSLNTGVYVQEFVPNFSQGDIRETGIGTDVAIVQGTLPDETGAIFFTVQNEAGEVRYTRNGNFTVDGAGYLVTNQGYYVLDSTGNPIQTGGMEFTITPEGLLQTPDMNVPLGLAYAANANELVKEGDNLFAGEAGAIPAGATYSLKQGYVESSNVDAIQTMTDMMNAYRVFETNQRVLKAYDDSMEKAVTQIGRVE